MEGEINANVQGWVEDNKREPERASKAEAVSGELKMKLDGRRNYYT